jgi:hypothetical protein
MTASRSQHSATLLPDGRVLIAGGASGNAPLLSTEIYDPATGTFRAAALMTAARRMHTATLLPDDRVLVVGGYGAGSALATAELFDPRTGTFTATGSLSAARGGHTAILLATGKVLIIGGYGWNTSNTYPDIAPAELYDPVTGTFASAGSYVGRGGCDFCAPSVLLPDGGVLFPGQYPAQLYNPAGDVFSPIGMMAREESAATVLMTGQVLFAGGAPIGRIADAELYNPATRTFASTGSMAAPRVWHSLTLLPNGMVLAAGGETDNCSTSGCWFAGSLATAELYDPSAGRVCRDSHHDRSPRNAYRDGAEGRQGAAGRRRLVRRNRNLRGSLASAELYSPDTPVAAPALVSVSGDGQGQGAIFHAGTRQLATAMIQRSSATASTSTALVWRPAGVLPPQVAIGGRMAALLAVSTCHRARRDPGTRSRPNRHHAGTGRARAADLSRSAEQRSHDRRPVIGARGARSHPSRPTERSNEQTRLHQSEHGGARSRNDSRGRLPKRIRQHSGGRTAGELRSATPSDLQGLVGDGRQRRILLRGGVVLSLDPKVGDFDKADVLIDGKRIAEIAPTLSAGDAEVVDCAGTIVMPGFITTHHHQYETLQRSVIPDGCSQGRGPRRAMGRLSRTSGPPAGLPIQRIQTTSYGIWVVCRTTRKTATSRNSSPASAKSARASPRGPIPHSRVIRRNTPTR